MEWIPRQHRADGEGLRGNTVGTDESYANAVGIGTMVQQTVVLKLRSCSYCDYRYVFIPVPLFSYLISLNSHA